MPGYLYYIPVPLVTKDQLSDAQQKRIRRDTKNTLNSVILDEDIEVVREEEEEIELPPMHHHVSTRRHVCMECNENLAYDQQSVPEPE